MTTFDLMTDRSTKSNTEAPSNTYTIRPNFQHKYVASAGRCHIT